MKYSPCMAIATTPRGALTPTIAIVATKKPGILIHVPQPLLDQIDAYWHDKRFPNRSEAMRFLLEWAVRQSPDRDELQPAGA
jgi:hypothetical protein